MATRKCTTCSGWGWLNCNLCGGRKFLKAHEALRAKGRFVAPMSETVNCPVCGGRGGTSCWDCEGSGLKESKSWWKFWASDAKPAGTKSPTASPELENQLFLAVKNQNVSEIAHLLERGVDANAAIENNWTCLHEAATTGPAEMIGLLIKHGAKLERRTSDKALTPLHVAALWQQRAAAKALMENGADKAAISKAGKMPRDYALGLGDSTMAILLSTESQYL